MERDTWNPYFEINKFPIWNCPTCGKGRLLFDKNNFVIKGTAETQKFPDSYFDDEGNEIPGPDISEWDGVVYYFTGFLNCENKHCKEPIGIIGEIIQTQCYHQDEETKEVYDYISDFYYPKHIFPTINIFPLHINYSDKIKMSLQSAFKLLWCDYAGCANKIRIVIETILDNQKIKKFIIKKNKNRSYITLHQRIELFQKKNPKIANLLYAIKWLGNDGSHKEEKIEFEDLLNGFELLENVLEELYHKKESQIKKIVKKINRKYQPRKR